MGEGEFDSDPAKTDPSWVCSKRGFDATIDAMTEEGIFSRASELPLEAREAFLREACGEDEALLRSVEGLLDLYDSGSILVEGVCEEAGE